MRRYRRRSLFAAAACAAALTACSSGGGGHATSTRPAPSTGAPQTAEAGAVGTSPGGVTTRIDVPAESTEEQYAQACMAAKKWMEAKGGDPATLVEPFLKELQSNAAAGPATFDSTWRELSTAQQAAVIIAVRAAAEDGC